MQVHVQESTDGGATWTDKFTTPLSDRSGTPSVAIKPDGTIALLYNGFTQTGAAAGTGFLTQHLITTSNDFRYHHQHGSSA